MNAPLRNNLRAMLIEMERRMVAAVMDGTADSRYPRRHRDGPRYFGAIPYTLIVGALAVIGRKP